MREKVAKPCSRCGSSTASTRSEILALYLNLAPYGNQIAGAERASRAYFGCVRTMLTPAQAAFLAGLPQRPSGFNPYRGIAKRAARQRTILRRMHVSGALTPDQCGRALGTSACVSRASASPFLAPHFVEMVLAAGRSPTSRPGSRPRSTPSCSATSPASSERTRRRSTRHGAQTSPWSCSTTRAANGWRGRARATTADARARRRDRRRAHAAAAGLGAEAVHLRARFRDGFTPASVLADVPSHFPTAEAGRLYSPRNYDGRFRGPLRPGRARRIGERAGRRAGIRARRSRRSCASCDRAGFTTFDQTARYYGLGLTLGNAEVRLDELVAAYCAFARGGEWLAPIWSAPHDAAHVDSSRERRSLVSQRTAFWITDILSDA